VQWGYLMTWAILSTSEDIYGPDRSPWLDKLHLPMYQEKSCLGNIKLRTVGMENIAPQRHQSQENKKSRIASRLSDAQVTQQYTPHKFWRGIAAKTLKLAKDVAEKRFIRQSRREKEKKRGARIV
jgi:hypothetical protein